MKKRTGECAALLAGAVIAGSLGPVAPVLAASNEAQLEGEITAATGAAGVQTVTLTSNIALTGVLSNVTDVFVMEPGVSLTAGSGAAGAGHTGIAGDAGDDAGLPMLTFTGAGASLSNGMGSVVEGGTGGAGRSLTAADAQSTASTTLGFDGTRALSGQLGVVAGDRFDVTINGVIQTITIGAVDTLTDIAAKIEAAFAGVGISATATATGLNDTLIISQGGGIIESITINNNNNTPLTALGFTAPFPATLDPLFEAGGAGGNGAVAIELGAAASGIFSNEGTITGGAGGNGGSTLFRDGDGGVGGNGAAAVVMQNGNTATLQNTGTVSGGAGGVAGAGGVDGFDGTHGFGGTGVVMSGDGQTLINGGLIEGGLDGGGSVRADAVRMTGDNSRLELHAGFSFNGDVVSTGTGNTLALAGTADGSFNNGAIGSVFQGFDVFSKTGTGTWTLTGTDAQNWAVSEGGLIVNGTIGDVAVTGGKLTLNGTSGMVTLNGGTLGGSGAPGGVSVFSGSTLAPGNSIGTLNVAGNVNFASGSTYEVEVNAAGQSDLVDAGGTATIDAGAIMSVLPEAGTYGAVTQYTVLTAAGGVTGAFGTVSSAFAFLDPSLSYDANNVYLTLTRNNVGFVDAAATHNQRAVGAALDGLGGASPFYATFLGMSAAQAQSAFDAMSGEVHASHKASLLEDGQYLRGAITARLRGAFDAQPPSSVRVAAIGEEAAAYAAPESAKPAVWGDAYGAWGERDANGNAAAADRTSRGISMGLDVPFGTHWRAGIAAGAGRVETDAEARVSSAEADIYSLGLYGGASWGALSLSIGTAYAHSSVDASRSVSFGAVNQQLLSDYKAQSWQLFGEAGYRVGLGKAALEPFANLSHTRLWTDGFSETGGTAALTIASAQDELTASILGLRGDAPLYEGRETALHLYGMAGWQHAWGDLEPQTQSTLQGAGPFTVSGAPLAEDAALLEAGLGLNVGAGMRLSAGYRGQLADEAQEHGAKLSLRVAF